MEDCEGCEGRGEYGREVCESCRGLGYFWEASDDLHDELPLKTIVAALRYLERNRPSPKTDGNLQQWLEYRAAVRQLAYVLQRMPPAAAVLR